MEQHINATDQWGKKIVELIKFPVTLITMRCPHKLVVFLCLRCKELNDFIYSTPVIMKIFTFFEQIFENKTKESTRSLLTAMNNPYSELRTASASVHHPAVPPDLPHA